MELTIANLADRPDLAELRETGEPSWPEFMRQDPIGELYYADCRTAFPELVVFATDGEVLVASAYAVPFTWDGDAAAGELPVDGWDGVIWRAARDRLLGRRGNLVSALEITIRPDLRGKGLAAVMLDAMRRNAAAQGFTDLVAPVRPSAKHLQPHTPIADYAAQVRDDGLPEDPWLRVHVRAGGRIVGTCPRAMVIPGTLAEWREWTGLQFDKAGPVLVPEALTPVHCDPVADHVVYVEPGIWVHHKLG